MNRWSFIAKRRASDIVDTNQVLVQRESTGKWVLFDDAMKEIEELEYALRYMSEQLSDAQAEADNLSSELADADSTIGALQDELDGLTGG